MPLRAQGINIPIVPGLMPTTNFKGVVRMAANAAARACPHGCTTLYEGLDDDPETRKLIAAAVLAEQVAAASRPKASTSSISTR